MLCNHLLRPPTYLPSPGETDPFALGTRSTRALDLQWQRPPSQQGSTDLMAIGHQHYMPELRRTAPAPMLPGSSHFILTEPTVPIKAGTTEDNNIRIAAS